MRFTSTVRSWFITCICDHHTGKKGRSVFFMEGSARQHLTLLVGHEEELVLLHGELKLERGDVLLGLQRLLGGRLLLVSGSGSPRMAESMRGRSGVPRGATRLSGGVAVPTSWGCIEGEGADLLRPGGTEIVTGLGGKY